MRLSLYAFGSENYEGMVVGQGKGVKERRGGEKEKEKPSVCLFLKNILALGLIRFILVTNQ